MTQPSQTALSSVQKVGQMPFVLIIFGATGDLARNKLIPALFSLYKKKQLGDKFYIVGFARREFSDHEYRQLVQKDLDGDGDWEAFAKNLYYQQGVFDQKEGYKELIERLNGFDQEVGACIMRIFYLATPPQHYETILNFLQSTKLSEGCGQGSNKWTRLAIEKPFGKDLETARSLDKKLGQIFDEKQSFRVDHYLGKETVQNMIAFRFANGIFEPVWNNRNIDHVQITFAEQTGVEGRGEFFDGVGILRDVAQNHLLQLLAAVAMEQPKSFAKEDVRDARAKAIEAIKCYDPEEVSKYVVRGQYKGYRETLEVEKDSNTETFVAMKLFVETDRFAGVPFYLRAGKKMAKNEVKISIVFIQTCHILFKEIGCPEEGNVLTIRIQQDDGITLRVIAKKPGNKVTLGTVDMTFSYHQQFGGHGDDAYEKLLIDILAGDQILFNRSDELESSWEFIENVMKAWEKEKPDFPNYDPGTWGPKQSFDLIQKDGKKWL